MGNSRQTGLAGRLQIYDDLEDGGILALTVPHQVDNNLSFGHCNLFSPLLVIYHLVMAGFDCREISLATFDANISVVLRKRYNGIDRSLPMGTLPDLPTTRGKVEINGKVWDVRELIGKEVFGGMSQSFPAQIQLNHIVPWPKGLSAINW